jgi:hypothetical protein
MCKYYHCLGNKCCNNYVKEYQRQCNNCDSGGNCIGCKSGYDYKYFPVNSFNNCYKTKYTQLIGKNFKKKIRSSLSYSQIKNLRVRCMSY